MIRQLVLHPSERKSSTGVLLSGMTLVLYTFV